MSHQVRAPRAEPARARHVQTGLELREEVRLAGTRLVGRGRRVHVAPRACQDRYVELHGRAVSVAERMEDGHPGEPPSDDAGAAVPQREGDVGEGPGHRAEDRRPDLPDPERGGAVGNVGERQPQSRDGHLVAERLVAGEATEQVELQPGPGAPPVLLLAGEAQREAGVPHVAAVEPAVGGQLAARRRRRVGRLPLGEEPEQLVLDVQGTADEPTDGQRGTRCRRCGLGGDPTGQEEGGRAREERPRSSDARRHHTSFSTATSAVSAGSSPWG